MIEKRTTNFLGLVLTLGLFVMVTACGDSDGTEPPAENILPQRFGLDIPSALTGGGVTSGRLSSSLEGHFTADEPSGGSIYELLTVFIELGEGSSQLVEEIIGGVYALQITGATSFNYTSDDDGREKKADVFGQVSYGGVDYEYGLFISDAASEGNDDGGIAMRVYWNRSPIEGVAVLVPYNLDREEHPEDNGTVFRIEYDETGGDGYEAHMIVSLSSLPLEDPEEDPFSLEHLKMFVGKAGDTLDIYGNSSHPNAKFFSEDEGFNWAFAASGLEGDAVGVAEVGLPPNSLNSTSRQEILDEYAIRTVFLNQIQTVFPNIPEESLDELVTGTEAPGYFGDDGFIQGGDSPGADWDAFSNRIEALVPFNPAEISNLIIELN